MNDMSQPGSRAVLNQSSKYLLSSNQGLSQKKFGENNIQSNLGSQNVRYRDLKIQNIEANFESANNSKKGGNNRYQLSPKEMGSSASKSKTMISMGAKNIGIGIVQESFGGLTNANSKVELGGTAKHEKEKKIFSSFKQAPPELENNNTRKSVLMVTSSSPKFFRTDKSNHHLNIQKITNSNVNSPN